jgi:hypothetical protein
MPSYRPAMVNNPLRPTLPQGGNVRCDSPDAGLPPLTGGKTSFTVRWVLRQHLPPAGKNFPLNRQ